ncbi:MAG: alpha/beta fold hydrolase [Myxococcota bacterium]
MDGVADIEERFVDVEERFVDVGDVRLQVAVREPDGGADGGTGGGTGGDRLALCLHGFPESWYSWRHQIPLLARLGYRVWAPNLRGYGESDRPRGYRAYSIENLMGDIAGLIDAAGARETVLLAHDWGAIIAWYFAMRRVRPLHRLVILNVPHPGPARRALRRSRQLLKSWYMFFFQLPWLPERLLEPGRLARMMAETSVDPSRFGPEVQAVYARGAATVEARRAMLDYYRALLRGGGARRQAALGYPEIETPTLMIWGEQDVALTLETTRGTERWVRDLTLRRLPAASHWVQQDAPEVVNALIEAWLAGGPVPEVSDLDVPAPQPGRSSAV